MKPRWLILLLAVSGCHNQALLESNAPPPPDYIAIEPTGMEEHHIRTLIISTRYHAVLPECDIHNGLDPFTHKPLTAPQREAMQNMECDIVRTDSFTYQSVIDFVQQNQSYFSTVVNDENKIIFKYIIIIKERKHGVYLTNYQFFTLLSAHLHSHNRDKALIAKLHQKLG